MHWSDYVGWLGFAIVLGSYLMVALQKWRVRSIPNQLGNIVGPGSLGINSLYHQAWVPVTLNVIWVSVALFTLIQIIHHGRKSQ
ncbi:MAG: hypothetical protein COV45_06875 [Deltaproteobacteria bacterium CG11_big_fil_rev_8_21_14_0_20_47_16]|nr:MAG: hypothetical protein COV45_06875 [Deltaproteobacteria bacterium CG11_big_fil_rev_8_21_14_0_20_47_16]